jgi:hypothetical protein
MVTNRSMILPLLCLFTPKAGLFDEVIVNDDFQVTVNAFFRLMRDWYVIITCVYVKIFLMSSYLLEIE